MMNNDEIDRPRSAPEGAAGRTLPADADCQMVVALLLAMTTKARSANSGPSLFLLPSLLRRHRPIRIDDPFRSPKPDVVSFRCFEMIVDKCVTARFMAARNPVYMSIVLDGSGSMSGSSKWSAAVLALRTIFADVAAEGDPSFGVGLVVFGDSQDPTMVVESRTARPYPSSVDVPIRRVDTSQFDQLNQRLSGAPYGLTPSVKVLEGVYNVLESLAPPEPLPPRGTKDVVFMSDGLPTGEDPKSAPSVEQTKCMNLAASKLASPSGAIRTFAIGIGRFGSQERTDYDPRFMARLAVAGRTAPKGCDVNELNDGKKTCYFQITPASDMTDGTAVEALKNQFLEAIGGSLGVSKWQSVRRSKVT